MYFVSFLGFRGSFLGLRPDHLFSFLYCWVFFVVLFRLFRLPPFFLPFCCGYVGCSFSFSASRFPCVLFPFVAFRLFALAVSRYVIDYCNAKFSW